MKSLACCVGTVVAEDLLHSAAVVLFAVTHFYCGDGKYERSERKHKNADDEFEPAG